MVGLNRRQRSVYALFPLFSSVKDFVPSAPYCGWNGFVFCAFVRVVRGGGVNPVVLPLRICNLRLDFWQRPG